MNTEDTAVAIIPRGFGGLVFDAIFEEAHSSELEVTDNPVETGVSITDHAYVKPYLVRITAGVTNTQLRPQDDGFGLYDVRIKNAFQKLKDLQKGREPFDVQTGLCLYKNMVCTSVRTVQDAANSNALVFEVELREIIIVNTQLVTYPPRKAGKAANQAGKKKESGEKQGTEVPPAKKASLAKRLGGALGGS